MSAAAAESPQEDFCLRIDVGRNLDGAWFVMDPLSEDDLQWLVPEARQHPRIFMARGHKEDFQNIDRALCEHLAELLTGLSVERLKALGVRLVFMEPHSGKILYELAPA